MLFEKNPCNPTFGDLVLGGLLGFTPTIDGFTLSPLVPDRWEDVSLENLTLKGHRIDLQKSAGVWRVFVDGASIYEGECKERFTYSHVF